MTTDAMDSELESQTTEEGGERWLGANIYLWERLEQNRLLARVLAPEIERLYADGAVDVVFYDRFDSRGPHVFLSLRVTAESSRESVRSRLRAVIEPFLAEKQPSEIYDEAGLAKLHEQCRGKALWHADHLPGLASDRSLLIDEQQAGGYPFLWWRDLEETARDRVSELVGESTRWALGLLPAEKEAHMGAAVAWSADYDSLLRRRLSAAEAADYWRVHASTLIMGLDERWREEPEAVRASLPGRVAAKTAAAFGRQFDASDAGEQAGPWPPMEELVELVLRGAPNRQVAWRALREIHHVTWKQLGLYVRFHLPIVLFAWNRNLELAGEG